MSITILQEPNLEADAFFVLASLGNGDTIEKMVREKASRTVRHMTEQEREEICAPTIALEQAVAKAVSMDSPQCKMLFFSREETAPLAMVLFQRTLFAAEDPRVTIARLFTEEENINPPTNGFASDAAFMDYIDMHTAMNAEEKYNALRLLSSMEYYQAIYDEKIRATVDVLKALRPTFDSLLKKLHRALERQMQEGHQLFEDLGLRIDGENDYILYPSLERLNSISMHGIDDDKAIHVFVGCGVFPMQQISHRNEVRQNQFAEFLKTLADPTKMDILRLLKERTYYSSELARTLGLTGATISYHMAALLSVDLLFLNKQGNRLYYERNEEALTQYLQQLEKLLK